MPLLGELLDGLFPVDFHALDDPEVQEALDLGGEEQYPQFEVASRGFPNLFMLTGPGSPSVLSNVIVSAEQHVNWLTDLIAYLREQDIDRIEADPDAQTRWGQHVTDMASESLYPQADSWYLGANMPGKPRVFMPYDGFEFSGNQIAAVG